MTAPSESALLPAVRRALPDAAEIANLARLTGGANKETWAFDAVTSGEAVPLILRRLAGDSPDTVGGTTLPPEAEARVQAEAHRLGALAPEVLTVLGPDDGLGRGYVMRRVEGEALPPRIARDPAFDSVRDALAARAGDLLGRLQAADAAALADALPQVPPSEQFARYRRIHEGFGEPHPVFALAFRWLAARMPPDPPEPKLVHGDFRFGNLLVDPGAGHLWALDWELAHLGDPHEDLGWLCVPSWRFGRLDKPAGGFGSRTDFHAAFAVHAGRVDPERARWWEVFGALKWGVMCQMMADDYLCGRVPTVERAAIGRRVSETELDLLDYIEGRME